MNENWMAPTERDRLRALRGVAKDAPAEKGDNPLSGCDCGRETNVDMLVDLRGLPRELREALGVRGTAACDGCRERWFAEGRISRADFVAALGAPAALVARLAGRSSE